MCFTELVRAHEASVRLFLMRAIRDTSMVDDIAQEVFLHAYRRMDDFRGDGTIRAWLLGIARNLALQYIRSNERRRARETGPLQIQLAQWRMERLEQDPWDALHEEQTLQTLRDCLGLLTPMSKSVVHDHYFNRMTIEEIAKRFGRTGGSVRMMLFRIRQVIANCLRSKLEPREGSP